YFQRVSAKECDVFASESCIQCIHEMVTVGILSGPCPKTGDKVEACAKEISPGRWRFNDDKLAQAFQQPLVRDLNCRFPTGWFCTGSKKEACKACKESVSGVDCDTYAWVVAGGEDAFARFAITVLALATVDPPAKAPKTTIQLEFPKKELQSA